MSYYEKTIARKYLIAVMLNWSLWNCAAQIFFEENYSAVQH